MQAFRNLAVNKLLGIFGAFGKLQKSSYGSSYPSISGSNVAEKYSPTKRKKSGSLR